MIDSKLVERLRKLDATASGVPIFADAADEIERLRAMLMKIAEHPDTTELIKQYAAGKLA